MKPVELHQAPQKPASHGLRDFFRADPAVGISKFRVQLLRAIFTLNAVFLGMNVWRAIFTHEGFWEPLPGIAFSFWAAFSALSILGILHPVKMIPLLLVQFSYKVIWLIIVAYPLWSADQLTGPALGLTKTNAYPVVVDLFAIPWLFVFKNYILRQK